MKGKVRMGKAGRVVFPRDVRERLHVDEGSELEFEIVANRVEFRPVERKDYSIVKKGKLLVIQNDGPGGPDAVAAIKSDREERIAKLSRKNQP